MGVSFLDITDLHQLPVKLTQVVKLLHAGINHTLPTMGKTLLTGGQAPGAPPILSFSERMATMHFLTLTAVQISDMEVNLLPGLGRFFGQLPGLSPEDVLVVVDCHI